MAKSEEEKGKYIRRYILSSAPLLGTKGWDSSLTEYSLTRMDSHRKQKFQEMKNDRARAEQLAAGVLLQYAVQEYLDFCKGDHFQAAEEKLTGISWEALRKDQRPLLELNYRYGTWGKPYLQEIPLFFSLSHSHGTVLCVVSEVEVGADIQYSRDTVTVDPDWEQRLLERFFSEQEKQEWSRLAREERRDYFYRQWTRKEAYGKLTGKGIVSTIGISVEQLTGIVREEYRYDDAYISVCMLQND